MLKPFAMQDFIVNQSAISDDLCTYLDSKKDEHNFVDNLSFHLYRFTFEGKLSLFLACVTKGNLLLFV